MILPAWMGEFGTLVVATGGVWVVSALGLHVLIHWAGQISLGHVAFVALGAFLAADLAVKVGFPFWLAIPVAAIATTGATALVGLPALRIRGFHLAIVTLAFGYAADRWLFQRTWLSGGATGIILPTPSLGGVQLETSRGFYYPVIIVTVGMVALAAMIGRSKAGRALRAIRADENVASAWGINVSTYKLLAFAVAGFFAAVAGGLQAFSLGLVGPLTFPVTRSIQYVAIVVIGGAGNIWGTVIAAAAFGMLPSFGWFGRFSPLVGAVGMLAILVQYPGGLNEQGRRLAAAIHGRIRAFPAVQAPTGSSSEQ